MSNSFNNMQSSSTKSSEAGYIYILTNKSFCEDWVKIGKSSRPVDVRSKELDNTAVPLPFDIYATMKTTKYSEAEKLVHRYIGRFTDLRIRQNREFFNVKPEVALEIFYDVADVIADAEITEVYRNSIRERDASVAHQTGVSTTCKKEVVSRVMSKVPKNVMSFDTVNWLIPGNKKFFNLDGCFATYGGVYWKIKSRVKEGDIVYVYSAGKDRRILYKLRVTKTNVAYNEKMDRQNEFWLSGGKESDDTQAPRCYLEFINTDTGGMLGLKDLQMHGFKGNPMGPRTLHGELLNYIEQNFKC